MCFSLNRSRTFVPFLLALSLAAWPGKASAATLAEKYIDAIHGGVVADSWAGSSTTTTFASGNLQVQIPLGATVRRAYLITSMATGGGGAPSVPAGPAGTPRGVILGPGAVLTRTLEGSPDHELFGLYSSFTSDVTSIVGAAIPVGTGSPISIPIQERGDEGPEDTYTGAPKIFGHTLVVVYDLASAPLRNVVVLDAFANAGPTGTVTFKKPTNACAAGNQLSSTNGPLSISMASQLGDHGIPSLHLNGMQIGTKLGGADDGTANVIAQEFTGGSFGATNLGLSVGLKGDTFGSGATDGRDDDELYSTQGAIPDGATNFTYRLSVVGETPGMVGPVLFALVLQTDAKELPTDTDGDGIDDATEGGCSTDSDGDGVPDYQDLDSDNDCARDGTAGETGNARTDPKLPAGNHCTGNTAVCMPTGTVGTCVACANDFGGAAPACPDSSKPICIKSGANAGSCSSKAPSDVDAGTGSDSGTSSSSGGASANDSGASSSNGSLPSPSMMTGALEGGACAQSGSTASIGALLPFLAVVGVALRRRKRS